MTRMARIVIRRAIKVTGLNLGINTVASPWLPIDISGHNNLKAIFAA